MAIKKAIFYVFLFCFSFVFFVYISFPYAVLKEAVVNKLSTSTGLYLSINKLKPIIPLGFDFEGVEVRPASGDSGIDLKRVEIRVGLMALLWGSLGVDLRLSSKEKGQLDLVMDFGLFDLLDGHVLPSNIALDSRAFKIGHLMKYAMAQAKESLKSQAIVADLIGKFGVRGDLDGQLNLKLNEADMRASQGSVNLMINNGLLTIDESMNMSDQQFKKALIKANLQAGKLLIDKTSGFHTQGLVVDFDGVILLKKIMGSSSLDISIAVKLLEELKDQFGFMVDSGLGGTGGAFKAQIRGTLSHPNFVTL